MSSILPPVRRPPCPGVPGPPGPPGKSGIAGIDASLPPYYVGSGGDDSAGLQMIHDLLTDQANHTITVPPGTLNIRRPVMVYNKNLRFLMAGMGETNFYCDPGWDCFLIGQVNPQCPDGFTYGDAGRPDLYGIMDASIASGPGVAFGFDTQSRSYAVEKGNGIQNGGYNRSTKVWDYWATATGYTIEFAIGGTPSPGKPLMGAGPYQTRPSPVYLTTGDTSTNVWLNFCLASNPTHVRAIKVGGFDFSGARAVNRGLIWIDFTAGTVGAIVNGVAQTPTAVTSGDLSLTGDHFQVCDQDQRFSIGGGLEGNVTPFKLYGLCVSNVAVKTDAGTDAGRYLKVGSGVVGGFNVLRKDPGRILAFNGGLAAADGSGYAVVLDQVSFGISTSGTQMDGFTCNNGGIAIAGILDTDITNYQGQGDLRASISCFPNFANYRLRQDKNVLSGDVAAEILFEVLGYSNGNRYASGGIASVIDTSCSMTRRDAIFSGFGNAQQRCIDLLGGGYGGQELFEGMTIDGESNFFAKELIRVYNTVGCLRSVVMVGGAGAGVALSGVVFRLIAAPSGSSPFKALMDIRGFGLPPASTVADIQGTSGEFIGIIDLRQATYLSGPTGAGFDSAKLLIQT